MNNKKVIKFKDSFLDVNSPEKSLGIKLSGLSLNQTYYLQKNKSNEVCQKLYGSINQLINKNILSDLVRCKNIVYRKVTTNENRTYIHLLYITKDGSRISSLVRFLEFGENLYVGVSGYALRHGISWLKLFIRIYVTIIFFSFVLAIASGLSQGLVEIINYIFPSPNNFFNFAIYLVVVLLFCSLTLLPIFLLWGRLILRIIENRGKFRFSLRQEFPKELTDDQFDYDDIIMFSKSTTHLIVSTIGDVLSQENIAVDSLDDFVKNINNMNINTGGGLLQIIGSSIGINNTAN